MPRNCILGLSFWYRMILGMYVLTTANAILLGYAWSNFALSNPQYFADAWPTFSRALTFGPLEKYKLLAAIAGAGLFFGAASLAVMRWQQSQMVDAYPWLHRMRVLPVGLAAPLGIVHYYHVVIRLNANTDLHMLMSYIFFFGMSFVIIADLFCSLYVEKRLHRARGEVIRRLSVQHKIGVGVMLDCIVFLVTFILKDVAWNPWPVQTQRLFVVSEWTWIVLAHTYAVLYVQQARVYFRPRHGSSAVPAASAATALCPILLAALVSTASPERAMAQMTVATTAIGGTGRIQAGSGTIVLNAPSGRIVERVTVKPGERVRKGTVLVIMSDHALRLIERDSAAERQRDAERQYEIRATVSSLDVEAARLSLAQARDEAEAIAALDRRTIAPRERRQRENAVALAETNLKLAEAKRDEARMSFESELKALRTRRSIATADVAMTQMLAPVDSTVLEVNVQAGASPGGGPAVTLADTSRMYVVADFFEGDLQKLAPGQRASVNNAALGPPLQAQVERIGRSVDPVNRLAKVWLLLDQTSPADRFIGMQVDVKVEPAASTQSKGVRP